MMSFTDHYSVYGGRFGSAGSLNIRWHQAYRAGTGSSACLHAWLLVIGTGAFKAGADHLA